MFKGILPLRRIVSGDFQMLTAPAEPAGPNGKENYPSNAYQTEVRPRSDKPKKRTKSNIPEIPPFNDADPFDKLLDELQIPPTIRPKLATMDPGVKAAMLKSSKVLAVMKDPRTPPRTPGGLRKAHSSESIASPRPQQKPLMNLGFSRPSESPRFATGHFRGMSVNLNDTSFEYVVAPAPTKPSKEKRPKTPKAVEISPEGYCHILLGTSSTEMAVETVKKLRLLLRNEAASWTQEFLSHGGYSALLTRLKDILDVEWREEQHDDQILHELLRCFKGLNTSSIGCMALRSSCPQPFSSLMTLLYSDKRPGEVGTRQLIIELLLTLFDLYPPSSVPAGMANPASMSYAHARTRSVPWDTEMKPSNALVSLPPSHTSLFSLIRELLLTPAPPSAEAPETTVEPHAFIEELHQPRIYKSYLQELNDICRDYFWVFCHPNNTIWNLLETDEAKVEKPRAPGGMTGGVEFEAIGYMTMHFKFLNSLSKVVHDMKLPKEHEHSAYRFHSDMFLSGIERIILIARKASTTYYPTLHLEIARYVSFVGRSGFELPWAIARIIGSPPSNMKKIELPRTAKSSTSAGNGRISAPGSPSRRTPAGSRDPPAPVSHTTPRKVTPMFG